MRTAFGACLQEIRERAGFRSRPALAEQMGFSASQVAKAESGDRMPGIDFLAAFARATGADLMELIRLRLEAAGEQVPDLPGVQDVTAGYKSDHPHEVAALRAEIHESGLSMGWSLLLMQLASGGDLSLAGARALIDFIKQEQGE